MGQNGGKRAGAGRKSKAEEIKLIERLTPMADDAYKALWDGVRGGEYNFIKLFFEYYAGKPKESVDITTNGESINILNLGNGIKPDETTE